MCVRVYVWNRGRYTCGAGSVNVWREGRACVMGACVCVCCVEGGRACVMGACVEGRKGGVCVHVWREGRAVCVCMCGGKEGHV